MRLILYIFSAVFMLNSIILVGRRSFTLGLAILFGISIALFILARYWTFWNEITQSGIGMYLKFFVLFCICCFFFLTSYVLSFARSTVDYSEKAIIVLGCGLNSDGTPSHTLQNRLDGCIEYCTKNPDCYIVVSGSYSHFNNITEGASMRNYLIERGISKERILMDEKATSTKENFEYSKQLLEEKNINTDNIAFVTNSFHIFRRREYGLQTGFENIRSLSVKTDLAVFIPAVIREVCGVAMQMFFKY